MQQGIPFIQPKIIHDSVGRPVRPRIVSRRQGEFIVETAEYWDESGNFIRKGIVSMTPIAPKK